MNTGPFIAVLPRWPQLGFTLTVRPSVVVFGRRFHSVRACGVAGIVLATALAATLIGVAGLSFGVAAGLLASGLATFFVLAMATKLLTGNETLIYYHHEIAILLVTAAVLGAWGRPVLPYLDLTALWLGVFLSCGRGGCLAVGCCHGRPHHWGVRYSEAHAAEGFPAAYVGVRLFPVQALEALIVTAIVVAGAVLFIQGHPAGTVLSTYVVTYSTARIGLEELRGDSVRPYWRGFSEGQWTSLALIAGVLLGEWQGRLPFSAWHGGLGAVAVLAMLWLAAARRRQRGAVHPRHAFELAAILGTLSAAQPGLSVRRTSQTVGVSTQPLDAQAVLYSLSRVDREMSANEARAISRLILNLACLRGRPELRQGGHSVFHLIVRDARR